jgi:single-strand DNA-binding protein
MKKAWAQPYAPKEHSMFIQMQALGKVECDPKLKITKDGTPVTEFSLAVNTKRCVQDVTIWLFCYAFGSQAEIIERSITKGSMLFVQGHFTPHLYTAEDGKQEVSLEVNIEKFSFANEANCTVVPGNQGQGLEVLS